MAPPLNPPPPPKMSCPNKSLAGKLGEALAAGFLVNRGCRVIEKNYRCPLGEIDLVVRDGGVVAFVEVRTRASESFGHPFESVDRLKRHRIRAVAGHYLGERGSARCDALRFDVVAIVFREGEEPAIEWIPGAFEGA